MDGTLTWRMGEKVGKKLDAKVRKKAFENI